MPEYRNPAPTVDIIIELQGGIVLIDRKNEPQGWALPGGFVDYGESLEDAARREAHEETSLKIRLKAQMHAYSDPGRDPRRHTLSVVFVAEADGAPEAGDDAKGAGVFTERNLPDTIVFDHRQIIMDYFEWKREGWKVFDY
ncbi:MAG TPA: NUDIX hydrolase [Thermodesulfobacteriota bacterium]